MEDPRFFDLDEQFVITRSRSIEVISVKFMLLASSIIQINLFLFFFRRIMNPIKK